MNGQEPAEEEAPGVCVQLTKIQARLLVAGVPGTNNPTQSVELGAAIPLQLAVTVPPLPMLPGVAVRLADEPPALI